MADEPVFETGFLLAGPGDPQAVERQLSRWVASGKVQQMRRGLYALAPPWRQTTPHPFLLANRLVPSSYVSGLSALAYAHGIPEYVAEVTSITAGRPHVRQLPFGRFSFRHLKADRLFGYRLLDLDSSQQAFVATPEKALLDTVYLQPGGDDVAYLRELRLDFSVLDLAALDELSARCASPKLARAVRGVSPAKRRTTGRYGPTLQALIHVARSECRLPASPHTARDAAYRRDRRDGLAFQGDTCLRFLFSTKLDVTLDGNRRCTHCLA